MTGIFAVVVVALAMLGIALYLTGAILMVWRWLAPSGSLDSVDAIGVHSGPKSENRPRALTAAKIWRQIAAESRVVPMYSMGRASKKLREEIVKALARFGQPRAFVKLTGQSTNTRDNIVALQTTIMHEGFSSRRVALVSSGYHRFRVERAGKREGFSVSFQRAASRSVFHILLEPVAIIVDLLPIRRLVYGFVRAVRTK